MKSKIAIIGSGNIGTDLLIKAQRSSVLEPVWVVGIDPDSVGLRDAASRGMKTTHQGLPSVIDQIAEDGIKIAFDATSARAHAVHDSLLRKHQVLTIDLTPAAVGPMCVPVVNLEQHLGMQTKNVNMVTCGGQATIPIVHAIARCQEVKYAEIVATIASKSAGPGTRQNIDEFTRTTSRAIETIGGVEKGKAIIILNPAEPPLMMRDTIHCLTTDTPNEDAICKSIANMVNDVKEYVPGFTLVNEPVFDGRRVSVFLEVHGLGDYLPSYAGNLDIMTAAAIKTAEFMAERASL